MDHSVASSHISGRGRSDVDVKLGFHVFFLVYFDCELWMLSTNTVVSLPSLNRTVQHFRKSV